MGKEEFGKKGGVRGGAVLRDGPYGSSPSAGRRSRPTELYGTGSVDGAGRGTCSRIAHAHATRLDLAPDTARN